MKIVDRIISLVRYLIINECVCVCVHEHMHAHTFAHIVLWGGVDMMYQCQELFFYSNAVTWMLSLSNEGSNNQEV